MSTSYVCRRLVLPLSRPLPLPPVTAMPFRCAVLLALAASLAPLHPAMSEDKGKTPNYPRVNLAVTYTVDPNWPLPSDRLAPGHVPGVAVDARDQIYVFVRAKPPVRVYSPEGKLVRAWGDDTVGLAHHLKIDHEGYVWLADIGLHIIRKFTPEGRVVLTIGTPGVSGCDATHLDKPTDMVVTPAGDLFVADGYGNNRVVHFDSKGRFIKEWGTLGIKPGQFSLPHAIALDSAGRLYVADRNNVRIQRFNQQGQLLDVWSNVVVPWGFWVGPGDAIWVCGCSPMPWHDPTKVEPLSCPPKDQLFMRFDTAGRVHQLWTVPKTAIDGQEKPGELNWLHCLALDSKGNIYAGDIIGQRIQKFVRHEPAR